nr:hypothetical protein [uncultured Methanobrevibacter sp.]
MKCNACGNKYSDEFDFCPFCGAYPKKFCPKCFKEINDGGDVCSDCRTELLPFEGFKKYQDLKEKALEYLDKDNFKKSTEYSERILEDWPQVEEVNFLLAENYAFLGEIDKSLRQYERLAEINPRYMGVYSRIAKISLKKKRLKRLRSIFKRNMMHIHLKMSIISIQCTFAFWKMILKRQTEFLIDYLQLGLMKMIY